MKRQRGFSSTLLRLSLGSPPLDATGLHLAVSAPAGSNIVVQVSTNLANWKPAYTNVGSLMVNESSVTNAPGRFYRAVMLE